MIVKETVFSRSVFERRYCLRTKLVVRIQVYDSFATQTRFVLFVSEFSAGRIIFCLIFFTIGQYYAQIRLDLKQEDVEKKQYDQISVR